MSVARTCLFPTDFQPLAISAAPVAAAYVRALGAALHVVHVAQPMVLAATAEPMLTHGDARTPAIDLQQSGANLERFCREHFAGLDQPPVTAVLSGSASSAIIEYAATHAVDLLIVPTHAIGIMKRMLMGSLSKALLEHASCPVLMIPAAGLQD